MAVVEVDGSPINVILSDTMPLGMPEHIVANADDSYTVFLNTRLSYEAQKEGFQHAIKHIRNNDYEKHDVQEIEMQAHGLRKSETQKGTMDIVIPWWIVDAILQLA